MEFQKEYYDKECTPEFPLRCDAGDLSGRHGPIDLGDKRFVFVDKNLPLGCFWYYNFKLSKIRKLYNFIVSLIF